VVTLPMVEAWPCEAHTEDRDANRNPVLTLSHALVSPPDTEDRDAHRVCEKERVRERECVCVFERERERESGPESSLGYLIVFQIA